MKAIVTAVLVLLCFVFYVSPAADAHKYVGVAACKPCHQSDKQGKQFDIWKASKHAEAYKTLESPEANDIAKKKGLTKPAAESPECLKCHVTGYAADKALFTEKFVVKDGIQCEACHGAGSDYKAMNIMKDKTKAMAAGLIAAKDDPKLCTQCHNEESPTFKAFTYQEYWDKVKHPIPAK
jgi:hypothetical protein